MTATVGRLVVDVLTNHSGGGVALGDVVILDTTQDDSFLTTTTGAYTGMVGVCIEPNGIANAATGRIQFGGKCAQINLSASVTRGHYIKTHTVAKQGADAGTSRVVGAFGQITKTGSTPPIELFGFPDAAASSASQGTPGLTLSTTNAAGSSGSYVGTDATIAAFDATAPSTQAFSDAAAAGSAGTAARRDHKHAMPASELPGAATSYTPALTAATTNPTLGTGSAVEGHYIQLGKLVIAWGSITFGSSGVAQGSGEYRVSLPVTAVSTSPRVLGTCVLYDSSATRFFVGATYYSSTTVFRFAVGEVAGSVTASDVIPMTWAANDILIFQLTYEAA